MILVSAFTVSAFFAVALAAEPTPPQTWSQKMRGLEQSLTELMIDLHSDSRFNSPKNFKRIEKNAEKFAKQAHSLLRKDGQSPDADPSIKIIAGQFAEEANHAYRALKDGHRGYARTLLRSMTTYCMACHTRNGIGPDFQSIVSNPAVEGLKDVEKAELLASTRQFDRALEEYEKFVAKSSNATKDPFRWEEALRSGMVLSIRVKNDPGRAMSFVEKALATPDAASYVKEQVRQWKKSILEWNAELKDPAPKQTEATLHAQAVKLIDSARAIQKFPADRSADVLYLRATRALHDQLGIAPDGPLSTDALLRIGQSYEVLDDLNLWDQHEFYYLACITKSPHSSKAQECFRNYEQSIYFGFSGSSGMHLPTDVRDKLRRLARMAEPETRKGGLQ